jgi:hypothetical protein
MIEATELEVLCQNHFQWHKIRTEFHKILPVGSTVTNIGTLKKRTDTRTEKQTEW